MKALYIIFHSLNKNVGITKKIHSQVKALNNVGVKTSLVYFKLDNDNKCESRWIDSCLFEKYKTTFAIKKNWKWRFSFNNILNYIIQHNIDFIYIRYTHFANPFFISFLKKLKQNDVKILLEIPTFPYDKEYKYINKSGLLKVILLIEKFYRRKFKKNITSIITFSNKENIFQVPTIRINNGIELENVTIKKSTENNHKSLRLIAVASMIFWHGYDRLIEGLRNYYSNENQIPVYINFVGDSENQDSEKYEELVKKYKLEDYVKFNGYMDGKELDRLFDNSDIAVGCLGVHRKGIQYLKSLKNSEYCARGIPFIYSENDDLFDSMPFVFKAPPDDSPINIEDIIQFEQYCDSNPKTIRNYAANHLTWDIQMKKIIQAIS